MWTKMSGGSAILWGSPSKVFALKLKSLKVHLKSWSRASFGSFKAFKEECIASIKAIDGFEEVCDLTVIERNLRDNLKWDF